MAAPVLGTTVTVGDTNTGSDTTQSFTTAAGETYMVVMIGIKGVSMSTMNGVTFGATPLTQRLAETTDASIVGYCYSGVVPASTTATVTIDYNAGSANAVIAIMAFTGVTNGVGTGAKQTNTSGTPKSLSVSVDSGTLSLSAIITAFADNNPTKDAGSTSAFTRFNDGSNIVEMDAQYGINYPTASWGNLNYANDANVHLFIPILGTADSGTPEGTVVKRRFRKMFYA